MTLFRAHNELVIGTITEVAGTTIKVELDNHVQELTRSYQGRRYPIGQIGSIVKVHFGSSLLFGFVRLLRMRNDDERIDHIADSNSDERVMEVELFAEGKWDARKESLIFRRGITSYPLPQQKVCLLTYTELTELYSAAEDQREEKPLVAFGTYAAASNVPCRANIDKMFGTHCAIVGSTGAGKSGAVAALLHAILDHGKQLNGDQESPNYQPNIIIIDPHGEYAQAFSDVGIVYQAYDAVNQEDVKPNGTAARTIQLPYWLMSADEFRNLVIGKSEHEATSQNNMVFEALFHARLAHQDIVAEISPSFVKDFDATDDLPIDAHRPLTEQGVDKISTFNPDRPLPFCLEQFKNHIRYRQGARLNGSNGTLESLPASKLDSHNSILNKLRTLETDARLKFLMENMSKKEDSLSLADVLEQLVGRTRIADDNDVSAKIRIIDMSGVPNQVAGPLISTIGQLLFQYKSHQTETERLQDPVLLVCEEAHRYIPTSEDSEYSNARRAMRRIAREGRKYGLSLMLVSQRPSDVDQTIMSQCGTWLALRLTNEKDQQRVASFLPDSFAGMTRSLSGLGQQEAIFVGQGAALPARIRIRDLSQDQLPRSETVSFADGWFNASDDHASKALIQKIADRMQNSQS